MHHRVIEYYELEMVPDHRTVLNKRFPTYFRIIRTRFCCFSDTTWKGWLQTVSRCTVEKDNDNGDYGTPEVPTHRVYRPTKVVSDLDDVSEKGETQGQSGPSENLLKHLPGLVIRVYASIQRKSCVSSDGLWTKKITSFHVLYIKEKMKPLPLDPTERGMTWGFIKWLHTQGLRNVLNSR